MIGIDLSRINIRLRLSGGDFNCEELIEKTKINNNNYICLHPVSDLAKKTILIEEQEEFLFLKREFAKKASVFVLPDRMNQKLNSSGSGNSGGGEVQKEIIMKKRLQEWQKISCFGKT